MPVSTSARAGPYIANKKSEYRMIEDGSIKYRKERMAISHLINTPGYVEATADNVHVVVSSGVPGGDYEGGSERVIDASSGG